MNDESKSWRRDVWACMPNKIEVNIMARVPYISAKELSEADRGLLQQPFNLYRALANSPGGLRALAKFGQWTRKGSLLSPRLRELAILAVSFATGSRYEFSHHLKIVRTSQLSESEIAALLNRLAGKPNDMPALEAAVIDSALQIATSGEVADPVWTLLHNELGSSVIVELVMVIGLYVGISRMLSALKIDVEDDYMPYLRDFHPANFADGGAKAICGEH
jgi:alkylhydroperoxidase family enzyme